MNVKFINISLILITIVVLVLNVQKYFDYTMDDAFIIMRYAENFAQHGKLVFNLDEYPPSEGITSPIWAIILSIFIKLKTDPLIISKILGVIFALLSGALIFGITNKILNNDLNSNDAIFNKSSISLFASCIFFIDPNTIINAVSGMETLLGVFLFLTFIYIALFSKSNTAIILSTIFGLAASLARPEVSILIIIIYILSLFLFKENRKSYWTALSLFILVGFLYFIYRYSYYQILFPLPFYLKQSRISGLVELRSFFKYNLIYFFFAAYLIIELFKKNDIDKRIYVLLLVILINLIYVSTIRHIMGFGFRYFQIIYPVLIISALYGFYLFTLRICSIKKTYLVFLTIILSFVALVYFNQKKVVIANKTFISWYIPAENNLIKIGQQLFDINAYKPITIGINDCGAIPYYSKAKTIDFAGLNNRSIATNFNQHTFIREIKKSKADVVIIGSKSENEYLPLWNNLESGFNRVAEKMAYRCVNKVKFFPNHYYWIYTDDIKLENKLKNISID